jgi:hypothetical protein
MTYKEGHMPKFPKFATDYAGRIVSRMRPAAGSARELAEAKAAAGQKKLPPLPKRKPKLAPLPPTTVTAPSGRKVIVR